MLHNLAALPRYHGLIQTLVARDLKARRGMMGSLSGGLATMCPGVPYALAAKFCHPGRPAIALVGDGASLWASGSHVCMGARPALVP